MENKSVFDILKFRFFQEEVWVDVDISRPINAPRLKMTNAYRKRHMLVVKVNLELCDQHFATIEEALNYLNEHYGQ